MTVDTIQEERINISMNIVLVKNEGIENIEESIKNEIDKYLLELRRTWEDTTGIVVRVSQIEARILNIADILDISNTEMNGMTSNIEISSNSIPTIGTVEVIVNENN